MGADEPDDWVSQIYESYGKELKRYLTRRLDDRTAAEDVAQDAYLQLHRLQQAQVRHPRALLFVTAANLATRYQQRRGNSDDAADPDRAEGLADPGLTPETAAEFAEAMRVLRDVVENMPERLRVVWVMRQIEGLSPAEIAERLGLSPKAVSRRLERAATRCRRELLKRGIGRPGA